jgi:hypothetical protein
MPAGHYFDLLNRTVSNYIHLGKAVYSQPIIKECILEVMKNATTNQQVDSILRLGSYVTGHSSWMQKRLSSIANASVAWRSASSRDPTG